MALQARDALWSSGVDESVEVNQRALIDKVLARYSGEFTVFRELLQNSDDAQSKAVEIRFETKQYIDSKSSASLETNSESVGRPLPDLKTALVHQWTFKNNGIVFRDEDWSRLKKIAEGNPDEEKIGAFGVGFYSLFSVTEEPFVTSGGQWMGFYWKDKKDQLFARRGKLPEDGPAVEWTSFEMSLREPAPIPVPFDFARFLASSITFMAYLSEVSVYFDDKRLVKLSKDSGVPKSLGIPKGIQTSSKLNIMNVMNLRSTPLHIKAEVMGLVYSSGSEKLPPPSASKTLRPPQSSGGFFSSLFSGFGVSTPQRSTTPVVPQPAAPPVDPLSVNETSVLLSIFTADVNVKLDKKISAELHRSTKKNPPSKLKYELIYTGKDQYDASKKEDEQLPYTTGSVFQGLRADLEGTGSARIFIGHATAQTTGVGGHMSSRFIPTVERESIDLMDRNVAVWNKELLFVGGVLARAAYELELRDVQVSWEGALSSSLSKPDPELKSWLMNRSIHALKFFTFHQSTPSADVSSLLESTFFTCASGHKFTLMSTVGVRDVSEIRLPDSSFSFLKELPVVPEEIMSEARPMITALQNRQLIKAITFDDVLKELRSRPLSEVELTACMEWWVKLNSDGNSQRYSTVRTQLLDATVLTMGQPGGPDEKIIPLNTIRSFLNPRSQQLAGIPSDSPLPDNLLPPSISRNFTPDALFSSFGFRELTLTEWLQYLCSPAMSTKPEYDMGLSAPWAEQVLGVLARAWPTLSNETKGQLVALLAKKACIPTSNGMKIPGDSYFANADIFHDLPVVTLPSGAAVKSTMERVLTALGVRKHVELQIIFNRMIKTNEWTIPELIKYLASVQSTLSADEWQRLKLTAAFSPEVPTADNPSKRLRAGELYEPLDVFRHLGLPVIAWGAQNKWRSSSPEAKLLFDLGLQRQPPLNTLINLCASSTPDIRNSAFQYLIENVDTKYKDYKPVDYRNVKFIPALKDGAPYLATPDEVYSNQDWVAFGFPVIGPTAKDVSLKLRIREHPPSAFLVDFLRNTPPKDAAQARRWFEVLAGRVADFSGAQLSQLSQYAMVPASQSEKGTVQHLRPDHCYFGRSGQDTFHSKLFTFVDFGTLANNFLSACGAKQEPSVDEIAQMLLANPHNFYQLAGGPTNFFNELRNIAVNRRGLSSTTVARMKKSAVLLGSQRKILKNEKGTNSGDYDDEEWDLQYDLKRPDQIIVADDTHALQLFGSSLFCAPQEDMLEDFYLVLGSRRLSSIVKEEYRTTVEVHDPRAEETRALILERLPLFLHEYTHAKTKVTYSWLNTDRNFVVKTFGKITVNKSLAYGDLRLSKSQDASAVAKRLGFGPMQLWIAANTTVDMYEVATSLCRLFFESPKANDALLFMTILSTDLRSLKRRGYNVDRILREQRAKRQAAEDAEKARLKAQAEAQTLPPPLISNPPQPSIPGTISPPTTAPTLPPPVDEDGKALSRPRPPSIRNPIQRIRDRFTGRHGSDDLGHDSMSFPTTSSSPLPPKPVTQRNPTQGATPISNIHANIDMAIQACRPESGGLLRNREHMQQVKETLNEGYCDISGRTGDLKHIGTMGDVKVYLSEEALSQSETFMTTKHSSLARFIHIITSVGKIYKLPLTSMHIFYDLHGGIIAFNRNGSIFLNLRYFESWHDADVAEGNINTALISWYFTLAHEIAHNLVEPHNSEHEFYFSAICEKHIMDLRRILLVG